jgi:RNA polymerase sigma factor (sigma-70 family)
MRSLQSLLHHARRVLRLSPTGGATDAQLLHRFRTDRDDAAFELLVWRHGPMVLATCRRILGDEHAAEDAFQTAFLALALKSGSIGRGEAVGAWLYRVAYRAALRLRAREVRRAEREQAAGRERVEPTGADPGRRLELQEFRLRLDAEIARLPEEYRTAFVLCHLEGRTNEQAARELSCPVGTIQSRLSRARARLRARLRKQGLGPETIPFILFIQRPQAPPDAPAALVHFTIRAALPTTAAAAAARPPVRRAGRMLRRAALAALFLLTFAFAGALAYAGLAGPGSSGGPDSCAPPTATTPPSAGSATPAPAAADACSAAR